MLICCSTVHSSCCVLNHASVESFLNKDPITLHDAWLGSNVLPPFPFYCQFNFE
jgi:hypothetical protein